MQDAALNLTPDPIPYPVKHKLWAWVGWTKRRENRQTHNAPISKLNQPNTIFGNPKQQIWLAVSNNDVLILYALTNQRSDVEPTPLPNSSWFFVLSPWMGLKSRNQTGVARPSRWAGDYLLS